MASLTLTVLSHPEYGSADRRTVRSGELTVGRGAECDWPLPDPMKSLSRTHCRFVASAGAWQVQDLSTNGTFVNAAADPIGRDQSQILRDGDRLRLGDYELEARLIEEAAPALAPPMAPGLGPRPLAAARLPGLDDPLDVNLRSDFDHSLKVEGTFPDHGAASADAFVPPAVVPGGRAGQPIVPDDWLSDLGGNAPATPPVAPPPPVASPIPSSFNPFDDAPAAASPVTPPAAALVTPAPVAPPVVPGPGGDDAMKRALAVLMAGGELPPEAALRAGADPQAALHNAGVLLRAAVSGIRALLIARGMVKREFRIEQTMLHTKDNNPLKFAASDEQALAALLDPRTRSLQAMQESINDLTSHQVAVLAATQTAARALLERLDPGVLEAEDTGGRKFLDSAEKRLWEAYKRRHAKLLEQFEDDFESAFGTAFARAYERALDKGSG